MVGPRARVVFIAHGSPISSVRNNSFRRSLTPSGELLGRPTAVLVVWAHWHTRKETAVAPSEAPQTIHDLGGPPAKLYREPYSARSGNVVHNLSRITPKEGDPNVPEWASEFDAWVEQRSMERDPAAPARYEEQGAAAQITVAMNDHNPPYLYSVGSPAMDEAIRFTHTGFQNSSISMRCFVDEGGFG